MSSKTIRKILSINARRLIRYLIDTYIYREKKKTDYLYYSSKLILPEYFCHGLVILLVLIGFDLITTLLNLPLLVYHILKLVVFNSTQVLSIYLNFIDMKPLKRDHRELETPFILKY